jgi:hypothetical protein
MLSRSKKIAVEKHALPATIDGICGLVRDILSGGSVQRVELSLDDVVRVHREVDVDPQVAEVDLGWDGATRNAQEFIEYYSEGASPFQVVFDMMHMMSTERLHSTCWLIGLDGDHLLAEWLELRPRGLVADVSSLMGLPIYPLKDVPEETLMLCGSKWKNPDPDEVSLVVKTTIEMRRNHERREFPSREVDHPVRDDPGEHPPAADQLAFPPGGFSIPEWGSD